MIVYNSNSMINSCSLRPWFVIRSWNWKQADKWRSKIGRYTEQFCTSRTKMNRWIIDLCASLELRALPLSSFSKVGTIKTANGRSAGSCMCRCETRQAEFYTMWWVHGCCPTSCQFNWCREEDDIIQSRIVLSIKSYAHVQHRRVGGLVFAIGFAHEILPNDLHFENGLVCPCLPGSQSK